jgi:hypothetical protein
LGSAKACVQSSGPEEDSDDADDGREAVVGLFVTCRDAAKCLDGAEDGRGASFQLRVMPIPRVWFYWRYKGGIGKKKLCAVD